MTLGQLFVRGVVLFVVLVILPISLGRLAPNDPGADESSEIEHDDRH
jgi:hypothetical protein